MTMTLVIGNKNLSSWSLRPWLVMTHFGIPFSEEKVRLDVPGYREALRKLSPTGLVPLLKDGDREIWDSLAICEYLAEKFPGQALWPDDPSARTHARCITAEMHAGFSGLRTVWPMDIVTQGAMVTCPSGVRRDLDRIFSLWEDARTSFGEPAGGEFLYGDFCIADAFFAPVVSRIRSYGPVTMPEKAQAWSDALWNKIEFSVWREGAEEEVDQGWYPR